MTSWDYISVAVGRWLSKGYRLTAWRIERPEREMPAGGDKWKRFEPGDEITISLELEKVREDVDHEN